MTKAMLRAFALLVLVLAGGCRSGAHEGVEITVMAASSTRDVMPALIAAFAAEHGQPRVRVAYGASGDLRKRVQDGAPADAVVFASAQPIDTLIAGGFVDPGSRRVVATNELVLIGPRGAAPLTFDTIERLPAGERLGMGDPASVPAGSYARQALRRLGKWDLMAPRMVLGGDVAGVLALARRGEVAAAVVYVTDVAGIDDVVVLDRAHGEGLETPQVVVGVVREGRFARQAASFLQFVAGPAGQAVLDRHGFGPP